MMNCYFITDANGQIGMGHLVRCSILAKTLREFDIESHFLLASSSEKVGWWLSNKGYSFSILPEGVRNESVPLISWLSDREEEYQFLVFDGDNPFFYNYEFQSKLRASGRGILMIIFHNAERFNVDILHNQNPLALEANYKTNPDASLLLGLEYAILKPEYIKLADELKDRSFNKDGPVMLTFGGADEHGLSGRVLGILNKLKWDNRFNIHVVLGALNPRIEQIQRIAEVSPHNVEVWVDTDEMPRLMSECSVAISSGGITLWELACCKTMNLVIPTSIRETRTSSKLASEGFVLLIGHHEKVTDTQIVDALYTTLVNVEKSQQCIDQFYQMVNAKGVNLVARKILDWFQANQTKKMQRI